MGLFTDKCEALIDPATKQALTGEVLAKARQDPKWPRCENRVSKRARFCAKCGSGAPGGWWRCPSCNKWVGNDSNFCPHCKAPLHKESRDAVAGGRWQRSPDVFAERIEVNDLKRLLRDGLIIETGTAAILLEGGKFKDVIGPGRHNLDSLARKINWWGDPPPRTVVLVENGDAALPLRIEALRTAEEQSVELYTEVCCHFHEAGAEAFVANLFKTRARLTFAELAEALKGDLRYAAENLANTTRVEDLVKDPQRRLRVEDALRDALQKALERYGLEIVRLAAVDFIGKEYEKLRQQAGETDVLRRRLEFDQRTRELLAGDRMQQFKSERDLEEYVAQLAQEREVSVEHRDHELARLKQVHRHELDAAEAARQMNREMDQAGHEIGLKVKWDDYQREKELRDAETAAKAKTIRTDAEVAETTKWIGVRREKDAAKRDDLAGQAKILAGQELQTLIALVEDPARREQLLALQRDALKAGSTPEQILAQAAERSPAAADALARMAGMNRTQMEKEFGERKAMMDEFAARLERVMKSALETTAEAARRPGSSETKIIK